MRSSIWWTGATTIWISRPRLNRRILGRLRIQRIGEGELDGVALEPEGERLVQLREAGGDEPQQLRGRLEAGEIDHLHSQRIGDRLVELLLGEELVIDEGLGQRLAGNRDVLDDLVDLSGIDDALLHEDFEDLFDVHKRGRRAQARVVGSIPAWDGGVNAGRWKVGENRTLF